MIVEKIQVPLREGIIELNDPGLGKAIAFAVDQNQNANIWFKKDPNGDLRQRRVAIVRDGEEIPTHWRYVATDLVEDGTGIEGWHLFQEGP